MDELPQCPLRDYFGIRAVDLDHATLLFKFLGISKCFTYPIIDVESSIYNVIEKNMVYSYFV